MEVVAGMPVASVIRWHSRTSASNPNQPEDVPFQAITSMRAWASSAAAARIGPSSNCASAVPDSAISVTGKRPKCADTSGNPASIAAVTGSSTVLEDGVNMPSRTRRVMAAPRLGRGRSMGGWRPSAGRCLCAA